MSSPLNVASHLTRLAATEPDRAALLHPTRGVRPEGPSEHRAVSFSALDADVDAIAHGLTRLGVGRGRRVALMAPPSVDFFALTFALFKVAAVPVLIDPGMGVRNLGACLGEAAPTAFIGIPKAHLARRLLGWGRRTVRTTVTVGGPRFFCDATLAGLRAAGAGAGPFPIPDVTADETAAILFTSGSTGVAKGAVYTHGIFSAQVEALKATYGIEPGEVDLCTFPLFALFGPALGMTCVIPDMDPTRPARIDPAKAAAQVRQFGATNLFGSPAVIRRLGAWAASGAVAARGGLPSLRRVISAGAPASARDLERFTTLLSGEAQVFTPYGATEALPVSNIGSREILGRTRALTEAGRGSCVGRPAAGAEVRVIRITDDPIEEWDDALALPPGEIGEFVVRAPVVTREYFNRPAATRLAKVRDPRTGEVRHRMGDVGYVDEEGRLWFCGRKSHRVEAAWGVLFTEQVEPIFNTVAGVFRTALVGVVRSGRAHPVLCFELTPEGGAESCCGGAEAGRSAVERLRERAGQFDLTRRIDVFLHHPAFPVDIRHNSKIFREKLAVWADRMLGKAWAPADNTGRGGRPSSTEASG